MMMIMMIIIMIIMMIIGPGSSGHPMIGSGRT